jgi:hypothetical protein
MQPVRKNEVQRYPDSYLKCAFPTGNMTLGKCAVGVFHLPDLFAGIGRVFYGCPCPCPCLYLYA